MSELKKKIERCRYSLPSFRDEEYHCMNEFHKNATINENYCEHCPLFDSRYIEYPIEVSDIDVKQMDYSKFHLHGEVGMAVAVRPCDEECKGKTYLGFYLGDLPLGISCSWDKQSRVLEVAPTLHNPAIFVPELQRIVFGCGCWWHEIESEEDLQQITDADINNVWYVKLMKQLSEKKEA